MSRLAKFVLISLVATLPALATPILVTTGTLQANILIDGSATILDTDYRTPGGGVILTDGVGSALVTDFFALPGFGNRTLVGFDSPAQTGTFSLQFDQFSGVFVGPFFQSSATGTLTAGVVNPDIAPFLTTINFVFAVNSVTTVGENLYLVDAYIQSAESVDNTGVPEPATFALSGAALALVAGIKRTRQSKQV